MMNMTHYDNKWFMPIGKFNTQSPLWALVVPNRIGLWFPCKHTFWWKSMPNYGTLLRKINTIFIDINWMGDVPELNIIIDSLLLIPYVSQTYKYIIFNNYLYFLNSHTFAKMLFVVFSLVKSKINDMKFHSRYGL